MKFSITIIVVALFSVLGPTVAQTGHTHLLLNDGIETSLRTCSDTEWTRIHTTLLNSTRPRRQLSDDGADQDRELSQKSCNKPLANIFGGSCPGPIGTRRLSTLRGLQTDVCSADYPIWNATLNRLTPTVTSTCRALLNSKRTFSCRLSVPCDIDYVSLWDADTNAMIQDRFDSGDSICTNRKVTFRAHTHFDLGGVRFQTWGPNNFTTDRIDWNSPYYMHSNSGTLVNGDSFKKGNYTITMTSLSNEHKAKTIRFESKVC